MHVESRRTRRLIPVALLASTLLASSLATAGEAKGSFEHKGKTIALKHAWLVKGPDAVDKSIVTRQLILSPIDLEAKLKSCKTMSCVGANLDEGLTFDLDVPPRINYWMVHNGQRVQYSGTLVQTVLQASPKGGGLAGKLVFDDTKPGGPKLSVDFDAPLVAEYKSAR